MKFDANDYKLIEEGKKKATWWGTVEPILITAPSAPAPAPPLAPIASFLAGTGSNQSTSAEISISKDTVASNPAGANRATSLQF